MTADEVRSLGARHHDSAAQRRAERYRTIAGHFEEPRTDRATLNAVRWLRAPDDEVFVWPAWSASHAFMRESLGYNKILESGTIVLDPNRGLVAVK